VNLVWLQLNKLSIVCDSVSCSEETTPIVDTAETVVHLAKHPHRILIHSRTGSPIHRISTIRTVTSLLRVSR